MVATVLTHDEQTGSLVLFAINRARSDSVALVGDVATFGTLTVGTSLVITDADPLATNTADHQDRVTPVPLDKVELLDGELHLQLPPLSWVTVTIERT